MPVDSEQHFLSRIFTRSVEKMENIESMNLNKVNIEFLQKQMEKALKDIEELKDKERNTEWKLSMI